MEERRLKLRRHIQAARAWLLQADKSLERENDVQGDLKLMLARAELAQTRPSKSSWVKRIFPPLTALMIVGMVMLSDQSVTSDQAPPTPVIAASEIQSTSEIDEVSRLEQSSPVQTVALAELPSSEESIIEETIYEEPPIEYLSIEEPMSEESTFEETMFEYSTFEEPMYEEEIYEEPPVEYPPVEEYVPRAEPTYAAAVPNEDMQQLMLDAGQILRAK